jgi:hypothetical protein
MFQTINYDTANNIIIGVLAVMSLILLVFIVTMKDTRHYSNNLKNRLNDHK